MKNVVLLGLLIVALVGCVQHSFVPNASQGLTPSVPAHDGASQTATGVGAGSWRPIFGRGKIEHVVVIVQENRGVDDLFNGFPGADTVKYGKNNDGATVALRQVPLTAGYDLSHKHDAWVSDYDNGNMDGFNTENRHCYPRALQCPKEDVAAYGYVPPSETAPYREMAAKYAFADKMFQSNEGPSFPAHQYLVSGTSTINNGSKFRAAENARDPNGKGHQGGCDSIATARVPTIGLTGNPGPSVYPCFARTSIMDLMNARGVSWRYYQAHGDSGAWNAVDAIQQIRDGPSYDNVAWPSARVLNDIRDGELAEVTFVTPSAAASDHAGKTNGTGPSWVASVVNAVGESRFWDSTAIFVTWDDWGGWYDHVKPIRYNSYELGFRVPLIVISPYAKKGYISHHRHEFGSILKFVEKAFALGSLGTTDLRADDLTDPFDFSQKPLSFMPIHAERGPEYFLSQPPSDEDPDDD